MTNQENYNQVKELVKKGASFTAACKELGVPNATMFYYRKKEGESKKKVRKPYTKKIKPKQIYSAFPIPDQAPPFELKGTPKQIAQFLKEMTIQFRGEQ